MADFYKLVIKEINRETPQAVSVAFNIPTELSSKYTFKAGQYVNLKLTLDGKEIRRAYSICSNPDSGELRIAIKAIEGGLFSNFANKQLSAGNIIEVSEPEGRFIFEPNASNDKIYAAVVAGSGITPVMSIIKTMLVSEPKSKFILIYGNKRPEETIFYNEINELQKLNSDRLFVYYSFTKVSVEGHLFGRIDKSAINFVLQNKHQNDNVDAFYLCGPNELIENVSSVLKEKNISDDKINFELFTSSAIENKIEQNLSGQVKVTVLLDDEETTLTMPADTTILDAVLKHGVDAPYSCQGGICSSCIARVTHGKAEMRKNSILTDGEIANGLVLTCQAIATTPEIYVDYDDI